LQLPGLPFSADILLITSVFFISGSLLRGALMKFKPNLLLVALSITLFYLICIYSDAHIDLNKRVYSSPFYATLGAFLGIYVVLSAAWYIAKVQWLSSLLLLFGEASLFILIFHVFIQENTYPYFVENVTDETTLMIMGLLSFLLSVLLPIGIKWLVLRSDILSLVFVRFKSNNLLQRTFYARR
jgi:fucose 4-O-acetylase-like acetyltransferase